MKIRVGQGLDVHAWAPDRLLVLGGVTIPYHLGLLGHSDADALTHAIIDALLGAAGLGDIGTWFPDSDPAFQGVSSVQLLKQVIEKIYTSGWVIQNIDCCIVAEKPKMAPYISDMKKTLADAMKISEVDVSIKATTTEQLGFVGRKEGLLCMASVLLTSKIE